MAQRRAVVGTLLCLLMCSTVFVTRQDSVESAPSAEPQASVAMVSTESPPARSEPRNDVTVNQEATAGNGGGVIARPTKKVISVESHRDERLVLRLPDRPIFSDYTAYSWPEPHNLTDEVLTDTALAWRSRASRPTVASLDFPCHAEDNAGRRIVPDPARRPVKLYVPWEKPTSNTPYPIGSCPVKCELTSNEKDIPSVDGYVVDTNGALVNEKYKWPGNPLRKVLIVFNTENVEGRRSVLKRGYGIRYLAKPYSHSFWDDFHIVVSYHWNADVRLSFFEWSSCRNSDLRDAVEFVGPSRIGRVAAKDKKLGPVLFFARNCDFVMHKRQGFVRKLREYLTVDAVGKCLNSRDQRSIQGCAKQRSKNLRPCIISQYHFYLSIENSISLDYVTEKVYEPLMVGTIPVYLGAPNIHNFLPAAHSAILAADFGSVRDLALYLKCVMGNRTLYEYYADWRSRPRLPGFGELQRQFTPLCQVCELISNGNVTAASATSTRPHTAAGTLPDLLESQSPLWGSCPQQPREPRRSFKDVP